MRIHKITEEINEIYNRGGIREKNSVELPKESRLEQMQNSESVLSNMKSRNKKKAISEQF